MKECDLVMRGGTTSGIVYPKALVSLSKSYRFRQIGGASAGAIAAAFAAAAEYDRKGNSFDKLDRIPSEFESGLAKYFQPYPEYQKLFTAFLNLLKENKSPGAWFFLKHSLRIRRVLTHLPATHFGICPGTTTDKSSGLGLIDWLNRHLEYVAGRMPSHMDDLPTVPLTFGELSKRNIDLRLISTNLSQRRPETLPIGKGFTILRKDLPWLLPTNVAAWIEDISVDKGSTYCDVPHNDDMPVILAVRMSLAFPLLFSTVPLYTQDYSLRIDGAPCIGEWDKLRINYFSDGGLSSNFPIHYFDAALPTRPTFGINLSDYHPCRHGDDDRYGNDAPQGWNRIYLPSLAGGGLTYGINPITGVLPFLSALLLTAKDWQDSVQMRLPGYRERIVHVALKEKEGGSNLEMDGDTIRRLIVLGELAGSRILDGHKFDPQQPKFSFQVHRWRRLLVTTEAIDNLLKQVSDAYLASSPTGDPSIGSVSQFLSDLINKMPDTPTLFNELGYPPQSVHDIHRLKARWDSLVQLQGTWHDNSLHPQWDLPSPKAGVKFRSDQY